MPSLAAVTNNSHSIDSSTNELEPCASLVRELSSQFNQLTGEAISASIPRELQRIGRACGVDLCTLIEFDQLGVAGAHHTWTLAGARLSNLELDAEHTPWMLQRLSCGEHVIIRPDNVPIGAWRDRSSLQRLGLQSVLAIPAAVQGHVVCALVFAAFDDRSWDQPLVDRLGLIAGILASALQRHRDESALRAHAAEIDRRQTGEKSDMMFVQEDLKTCLDFHDIVGDSDLLRQALERVRQVAPVNSTVLLLAETGTGKELFARAVHERSPRRNLPFVRVSCAALPPTLIESELFGHEKGAFTGAVSMRQGRFEVADGGTIFLDEIGDLPTQRVSDSFASAARAPHGHSGFGVVLHAQAATRARTAHHPDSAVRHGSP
jgi:formate hydrogenlyase transcriptional activator